MTIGFSFEEDYGDYVYSESASAYGMSIVADGAVVEVGPARIDLTYDVDSGWFLPGQYIGPVDFAPGEYVVSAVEELGSNSGRGRSLSPNAIASGLTPQVNK